MTEREKLENYVIHLADIRKLSSPRLDRNDSSELYSERLRANFKKIGKLAFENHRILDEIVFPLLKEKDPLPETIVEEVRRFNDSLVNGLTVEYLDAAVMSLLTDRLITDAEKKGDEDYIIEQLDNQIQSCSTFLFTTSRITTRPEIGLSFRERGLAASKKLLSYLDKDVFPSLSPESKERVLTNVRFHSTLYGSVAGITPEEAHTWVNALEMAYSVYNDPFYRDACPEFDWDYFLFRILEHFSVIIDYVYDDRIYDEDLKIILERVELQEKLMQSDPEKYENYATHEFVLTSLYFARYLSGKYDKEEYREKLLSLYDNRDSTAYDYDNLYVNLRTAMNYINTVDPDDNEEKALFRLEMIYRDICAYVFRMPNSETLTELMDYFTPMLDQFIEVPGGVSFMEMCLKLLAALHPPSYVHSCMVAKISRCLCRHLIRLKPEVFLGVPGYESVDDVREKADKLALFAYNAGLSHDFGKITMIDTIFIYGRHLLDFEFDIIRQHSALGAELMGRHISTKDYTDIALLHHKWYDDSAGYPPDKKRSESPLKIFVDITAVADCMDAATDDIGRSYGGGKSLAQYTEEVEAGAGTRYSPILSELLSREEVKKDLNYILTEGRRNNYRDTFHLLREVQEKEAVTTAQHT